MDEMRKRYNTPENHKKGSIGKPLENAEIRFENDVLVPEYFHSQSILLLSA
ncbi:MAG: hypothetical protein E6109_12125 [Ruminococcus sp.]|nr:hypothetical protein [Ruminococcus sp.]